MTWLTGPRFPCGGAHFMPSLSPCAWAKAASRRTLLICSAVRRLQLFRTGPIRWALGRHSVSCDLEQPNV
jgi:hypothetical protein